MKARAETAASCPTVPAAWVRTPASRPSGSSSCRSRSSTRSRPGAAARHPRRPMGSAARRPGTGRQVCRSSPRDRMIRALRGRDDLVSPRPAASHQGREEAEEARGSRTRSATGRATCAATGPGLQRYVLEQLTATYGEQVWEPRLDPDERADPHDPHPEHRRHQRREGVRGAPPRLSQRPRPRGPQPGHRLGRRRPVHRAAARTGRAWSSRRCPSSST